MSAPGPPGPPSPPGHDVPRPLAGVRVWLTRPPDRAGALCRRLRSLGAEVDPRPSIDLAAPRDGGPAERAVASLVGYDWLVFSSENGVRYFLLAARARGVTLQGFPGRIAAIGPATARALSRAGREPDLIAERSDGPGFAATLSRQVTAGQRVLAVRPEASTGPLEAALAAALQPRAGFDAVAFYRNIAAPGVARLAADVSAGRYDIGVFTSPSSLLRLLELPGPAERAGERVGARGLEAGLRALGRVAIGETTSAALAAAGFPADAVAETPTEEGIVAAVVRARRVLASGFPVRRTVRETGVSEREPRKTAMHALHVEAGARMVEFAGWDMPVQYAGVLVEHNAVREKAGLFDVSHMGEAVVRGPQALAFLQRVTCNDVAKLRPGRAHYSALTTPAGTFVDDLLIYMRGEGDYLLVLNAGNAAKDLAWLAEHAAQHDVSIDDQTDSWSLMALQGPAALAILAPLVAVGLAQIKYYRFVETAVDGAACIVSRTGYTGEHGFEIYAPAEDSPRIWQALQRLGEPRGLQRVGLAARDTLRLEAKMALYGNDIDDTTTVLEADLGWIVRLDKGDFIGRDALVRQSREGLTRKLVGFEMRGRGIARQGYPVHVSGEAVGVVTSGSFAPFLKKNIGLAYLPIAHTENGTEIEVMIRGRAEPAQVVPTPFYKRPQGV